MRVVYERKVALKGFDTKLTWIKSGQQSKVMDLPYEIYEKRYGPTVLTLGPMNANITLDFGNELRAIITRRHLRPDHLMQAKATAVIGKSLDTRTKARAQYRADGRTATEHTMRYRAADLSSLMRNLHRQLDVLAQLPSKPSWLVAIDVTIYFDENEAGLIRQSGEAKVVA